MTFGGGIAFVLPGQLPSMIQGRLDFVQRSAVVGGKVMKDSMSSIVDIPGHSSVHKTSLCSLILDKAMSALDTFSLLPWCHRSSASEMGRQLV